jgi:hypothetical protein
MDYDGIEVTMPGDTKQDRWLWKARAVAIVVGLAVVGLVYAIQHFHS